MTRRVLVTGGARGIGRAVALAFAASGDRVAVADLGTRGAREHDAAPWPYPMAGRGELDEVVSQLASSPARGLGVELDVTDPDSCQRAMDRVVADLGGLDVLVNCAGLLDVGPIDTIPIERWDHLFAVNVRGAFLMTRAALEPLTASAEAGRSPAVVNMASVCGKVGFAMTAAYCASKFALIGMSQSLALELAPRGIRVNAVCPGLVPTAMVDHIQSTGIWDLDGVDTDEARRRAAAEMFPLGRFQTPEDVAEAVLYLAGATPVTGVSLTVAGGQLLT
ncbi:MAG: SDR family NAD(P)-dependent oxidoreductase [Acidobacteriota bacterium]